MDYLPRDALIVVDESHVAVPQIGGMYGGDRSRKIPLVEYGFRLPSALDNRPLDFNEWNERVTQLIYASATPGDYEERRSAQVVEQIVRPTGLIDRPLRCARRRARSMTSSTRCGARSRRVTASWSPP